MNLAISAIGLGRAFAPAQDHVVVGIPHHLKAALGHEPVQRIKVDVREQRTDDRALRRTASAEAPVPSSVGSTSLPRSASCVSWRSPQISWPPSSCPSFWTPLSRTDCRSASRASGSLAWRKETVRLVQDYGVKILTRVPSSSGALRWCSFPCDDNGGRSGHCPARSPATKDAVGGSIAGLSGCSSRDRSAAPGQRH